MQFWAYLILFIFPFAGGYTALRLRTYKAQHLKLFLAFSGAFLFSITIISLLPELYTHHYSAQLGYFILLGFFLQILIDVFTGGIEHGHVHKHADTHSFRIFIALALHAFMEGMACGSGVFEPSVRNSVLVGIAMHEVPAAFALMIVLRGHHGTKKGLWKWLIPYAAMTPLGAWLANLGVSAGHGLVNWMPYIVATVIGVFLHISTTILFENSEHHRFGVYKILAVLAGASIALLTGSLHIHF